MKVKFIYFGTALLVTVLFLAMGCKNTSQNDSNDDQLKIGVVVPLTGNAGVLGDYTLKGLQLAVDEQNNKGGLLGNQIVLDVQDSKADPKEGVSIVKKMYSAKEKPFMVYSIMSGVTMAIRSETESNKSILMSAVGTDKFLKNSQYTFRNYVAANTTGLEIAKYLAENNYMNLTMFYSNNEYGNSVQKAVIRHCNARGIKVASEAFEETSLDYKSMIAAKVTDKTECVYAAGVGKGLGTIFKQVKESGFAGEIIGDQLISLADVVNTAGSALNGIPYLDFSFDPKATDSNTVKFVNDFTEKYGKEPQNFSAITYDGMKMLFDIIEKNKTIDSDRIVEHMNSVKEYEGVFGPISVRDRNLNFSFKFKTWNGKE